MESTNPKKAEFELLTQIDDDLWYAVKKDAYRGTKFLAKAIGHYQPLDHPGHDQQVRSSDEQLAFHDLMFTLNQAPAIAQIFNHENIVSIAGHIQVRPLGKIDSSPSAGTHGAGRGEQNTPGARRPPTEDFIVWDFCDASNLSALFQEQPLQSSEFYLPESLCWHVLTSLIRAVTWLHDGKREFFDPRAAQDNTTSETADDGQTAVVPHAKVWNGVDHDWNPILHRAIEPRNIFFQHPQGLETYGLCKLGNFEHAAVTNHVILPGDGPSPEEDLENPTVALAARRGHKPWTHLRSDADKQPELFDSEADRPYTLADELWSIGAVLLTMMTGQKPLLLCPLGCCHITTCSAGGCLQSLAARHACSCSLGGCSHLPAPSSPFPSSTNPCAHNAPCIPERPVDPACPEPVLNIDVLLTRARYTWRLRRVVKELLTCDPGSRARVSKVLPYAKHMLEQYRGWREATEEGRAYRDIEDDMAARWAAEMEERTKTSSRAGV